MTQYIQEVWQTEQGLPQNTVQAICQTRDGYLWLGTQEGLVRFDGVRFTVFDKSNTPELTQNTIQALSEDRQGGLWVGVRGEGLLRFKDGRFTAFTPRDGLSSDRVRSLYVDHEGTLWIGTTGGGLSRFRDGRFTTFTTKDGLSSDEVVAISEDREGSVWIGTFGGGLNRFRDGKFTAFTTKDGLSSDQISAILQDRQGSLWIGTFEAGVNRLRDGRFTAFTTRNGLSNDEVWSLLEDADGNIWIATAGGGVNRFRDGRFSALTAGNGLSNPVVVSLFEDRERSLWIGTDGGGLNRLRDGKVIPLGMREGLSSEVVRSVYEDREGTLWIGTDGGGLNRFKDGRFTALTTKDGLSNDHVASIFEDRAGSLWIGTLGGGLNRLRPGGAFTVFTTKQGLSSDDVVAIHEDREGTLWIGTADGLSRLKDGKFTSFTTRDGLSDDRIKSILEDRDGGLWVGTTGGLNRFKDGQFTSFTTKDGLSDDRVAALYQDGDGTLWIGTTGGGLNRFRDGRFTAITAKAGLHDDRVFDVLEDGQGNLWMSSNKGIYRARKQDLNAFADGKLARIASASYGTSDGMRSPECSGENQPAGWKTRDGRLWFPTIKGVAVIDPARLPLNSLPPPVALEEVVADGKSLGAAAGSPVILEPGSATLVLRYTALSMTVPQRVRFKYRLDGFDKDWIDAGTERTAHYTNLPPYTYRFRVKASNDDGVWNENGAALEMRLLPFFHQTRTFQMLCALGLVFLGSAAHRLRMRRLRRRADELERIVAEQTHDLRVANEDLRRAQEQLERLSEAAPDKLENVAAWGASMADEVGRAIHADRVHLWKAEAEGFVPLTPNPARPPSWDDVRAAQARLDSGEGSSVLPVMGMTNEVRGAVVIDGSVAWGETELRLARGLAQHLGSALDLQAMRQQLTVSASRQAAVRQRMLEKGVPTLRLCARCGRCYEQAVARCEADGSELDGSRLLPYRVLDRYRLTSLLGEGGMGSVFAAHDEKLGRDVALKVIRAERLGDSEARFRLEREARALAQVHHPSVVGLFDSGELEDGSAFLVMELLTGRNLADMLLKHGPGTPRQVATVLRQAGPALGAAHRVGVVHRDVKPANLLLIPDQDGFQTKVLDFGLAKSTRAEERLTQTGALVGTPAYMAPEQVEGRELDGRTDIYSLATVAYEALTGKRVVEGHEVGRMMMDVLYGRVTQVSSLMAVPEAVDKAFESALAKRPGDRPAFIEPWAEELARLLDALPQGDAAGWPSLGSQPPGSFSGVAGSASQQDETRDV